jgi:hypothetical protein
MKTIYNNIIPFKGFAAINLFGILFVRKNVILTDAVINHEKIHTAQIKELFYIFFYLWYIVEWLIKLCFYGKQAYYHISLEREAYINMYDIEYLNNRKKYSFFKYIKK